MTGLIRIMEIYGYDNSMKDFDLVKQIFPNVKFRYVVAPTKPLPSGSVPLVFSPAEIETMIAYGSQDAQDVVKKGEGRNLEELMEGFKKDRLKLHGRKLKKSQSLEKEEKENLVFLN